MRSKGDAKVCLKRHARGDEFRGCFCYVIDLVLAILELLKYHAW
jgi:hypothetical protein